MGSIIQIYLEFSKISSGWDPFAKLSSARTEWVGYADFISLTMSFSEALSALVTRSFLAFSVTLRFLPAFFRMSSPAFLAVRIVKSSIVTL